MDAMTFSTDHLIFTDLRHPGCTYLFRERYCCRMTRPAEFAGQESATLPVRGTRLYGAFLAGIVMISFSAVFVKVAHVGPTTAGFYRMAIGAVLLIIVARARGIRLVTSRRSALLAALAGLFFAGDLAFWHRSIHYVGPGLSTILANFQVVFLALIAILFLRERPGWKAIAAIPTALIGLLVMVSPRWETFGDHYGLGVTFGLITALFYAAFVLTLRYMQQRSDSPSALASITIASTVTAITLGFLNLAEGASFAIPDVQSTVALVAYGVCGQVLGWVLITYSIKHLPTTRVGLILLLQPALSFLWDILFFNRPTVAVELLGASIALIAIYLGSTRKTVQM